MNVLILNAVHDAHEYKRYVMPDFPEIRFESATEESEVGQFIESTDVLVTLRISDELLAQAKNLKWIHSTVTGTDSIESLPSFIARKEIILTSSRGIHGPQMSEFAIMLMIALNRQFPKIIRNQDRHIWKVWSSPILYGKTVGILGVGAIGRAIAEKCKAFEMTVLGVDLYPTVTVAVDEFYTPEQLPLVIPRVDYLISVLPLNTSTRNMLDAQAFSKMKKNAFFINLGRGGVVDEEALIQALNNRWIAGAALDTFSREPLAAEHPFWEMDNVIVTPHIGGQSDIYIQQAVKIFKKNLRRFLEGERENLINQIPRRV
jgi:D-2-hydroxyacid dehydrogenase (NADP+)